MIVSKSVIDLIPNLSIIFIPNSLTWIIFVISTIVIMWWRRRLSQKPTVPGIKASDPETGNMSDISASGGFPEFLRDMHAKFGPIFSFWYGKQYSVSIASHSLFKEQAHLFDRPPIFYEAFKYLITADSMQYANKEYGRQRRALCASLFTYKRITGYFEKIQNIVDDAAKQLELAVDRGSSLNLADFFSDMTMKSIALNAMGKSITPGQLTNLNNHFHEIFALIGKELGGTPLVKGVEDVILKERIEKMWAIIRDAISHRRKNPAPPSEHLLIDALLQSDHSDDVIFADLLVFAVGAYYTVAYAMVWMTYFLCKHPNVGDSIVEEIRDVLQGGEMTPEHRADLVYLKCVIHETLRYSQLATFSARYQEEDITLGGYHIPANTPVLHALAVSLFDETVFPEPEKFDPSRFLNTNLPRFAFEPFGLTGPRRCPGFQFAYSEIMIVMTTILPKFKFRLVDDQPVERAYNLVTKPDRDIFVTVEYRK